MEKHWNLAEITVEKPAALCYTGERQIEREHEREKE
jgi:hypothetical protein